MSASFRRRDISPQSRSGKLRMDRQPVVARITDPSLAAGKRKEIDNVMKKARATSTNVYWDKKLLEAEEKDPNRWRHTGYKKMYIEGDSSSESEREGNFRYNNNRNGGGGNGGPGIGINNGSGGGGYRNNINGPPGGRPPGGGGGGPPIGNRSRSRSPQRNFISRKTPPLSPPIRRRTPDHIRRGMMESRGRMPRSPDMMGRGGNGPRNGGSPMHMQRGGGIRRGRGGGVNMMNKSPMDTRRRSPMGMPANKRAAILPRSKRPPSPPPKTRPPCRSRSNSSVSSCSDDSCSVCSPKHHGQRSHSSSISRSRQGGPRSPPPKINHHGNRGGPPPPQQRIAHHHHQSGKRPLPNSIPTSSRRPASPPPVRVEKYRGEDKVSRSNRESSRDLLIERPPPEPVAKSRSNRHSSPPADPRLKIRPPEPPEPAPLPKKKKDKSGDKVKQIRTKIKIEGEKPQRKKQHNNSSTDSDDSESDSEGSLPTFTATTRLTLSERFGKMAQWSVDRSNMENMRITKDSTGGALKVMIEEGMESPPQRFSYSPAPAGHFPEELATTAPTGMLSWDDVRVRFEYYKSRGYLRDLDLKDYIKWEEWWYRYQEWLKQERYYEFWERQQMHRRRRKKIPIAQRLN